MRYVSPLIHQAESERIPEKDESCERDMGGWKDEGEGVNWRIQGIGKRLIVSVFAI